MCYLVILMFSGKGQKSTITNSYVDLTCCGKVYLSARISQSEQSHRTNKRHASGLSQASVQNRYYDVNIENILFEYHWFLLQPVTLYHLIITLSLRYLSMMCTYLANQNPSFINKMGSRPIHIFSLRSTDHSTTFNHSTEGDGFWS